MLKQWKNAALQVLERSLYAIRMYARPSQTAMQEIRHIIQHLSETGYEATEWLTQSPFVIDPHKENPGLDPARIMQTDASQLNADNKVTQLSGTGVSIYNPLGFPKTVAGELIWEGGGWLLTKTRNDGSISIVAIRTPHANDDLDKKRVEIEFLRQRPEACTELPSRNEDPVKKILNALSDNPKPPRLCRFVKQPSELYSRLTLTLEQYNGPNLPALLDKATRPRADDGTKLNTQAPELKS